MIKILDFRKTEKKGIRIADWFDSTSSGTLVFPKHSYMFVRLDQKEPQPKYIRNQITNNISWKEINAKAYSGYWNETPAVLVSVETYSGPFMFLNKYSFDQNIRGRGLDIYAECMEIKSSRIGWIYFIEKSTGYYEPVL